MALRLHQSLTQRCIKGFMLKELIYRDCNALTHQLRPAKVAPLISCHELTACLSALNITSVQMPPRMGIPPPQPLPLSRVIHLPQIQPDSHSCEDQPVTPVTHIEAPPTPSQQQPKRAARLIIIRKKKMQKHKLRKLRKKMKFEWAKQRQKREMKKEKLFQAELVAHVKQAMAFDPAQYAKDKIRRANEVELPKVWHGVRYPEHIIRQLLDEQEAKQRELKADEKRRASMSPYVRDYLHKLPK